MIKKGKLVKQLEELADEIHEVEGDNLVQNIATLKKQIYLIAEVVDGLRIAEWLEKKKQEGYE